ncbi:hypothetical protein TPA0598_02_06700 [Streptomyces lydicamycinicus]|uniref:Uncharacterized protein n=1 Tax=Streptomyces lydicamycinicus TaxID=1546107 RepID=A0A0P4R3A1_9ACTN|nr:hypothetical protein TPA0598_02_06700 [Streptomyces lydicamycinicus]
MRLHVQAHREDLVRRCGDGCHDLEMLHKLIIVQAGRMTRSGVGYSYIHTAVDDHSRLASSESTQMGRKKAEWGDVPARRRIVCPTPPTDGEDHSPWVHAAHPMCPGGPSPPTSPHAGTRTPIQVGGRWVTERTNSFGRLRCCTEQRASCVELFISWPQWSSRPEV